MGGGDIDDLEELCHKIKAVSDSIEKLHFAGKLIYAR